MHRNALMAAMVALMALGSAPARAEEQGQGPPEEPPEESPRHGSPMLLGAFTMTGLEILVPDVRYEFSAEGEDGWTLSWPIHLVQKRFGRTQLSIFGEPQLRLSGDNKGRLLGGARFMAVPLGRSATKGFPGNLGVLVEGGGLIGQDGDGGFAGGGLAWDLLNLSADDDVWALLPTLSLVYRRVWTDDFDRHSIALDFVLSGVDFFFLYDR